MPVPDVDAKIPGDQDCHNLLPAPSPLDAQLVELVSLKIIPSQPNYTSPEVQEYRNKAA